jgi:hypothetical protein
MPDPFPVWLAETKQQFDDIDAEIEAIQGKVTSAFADTTPVVSSIASLLRIERWGTDASRFNYPSIYNEVRHADRSCSELLLDLEILIRNEFASKAIPVDNLIPYRDMGNGITISPDGDMDITWTSTPHCEVNRDQIGFEANGKLSFFGQAPTFVITAATAVRVDGDQLATRLARAPLTKPTGPTPLLPLLRLAIQDFANNINPSEFEKAVALPTSFKNPIDDTPMTPFGLTASSSVVTIFFRGTNRARSRITSHGSLPQGIDIGILLHDALVREAVIARVADADGGAKVVLETFSLNTSDNSITFEVEKYLNKTKHFEKKKWGVTLYSVTVGAHVWVRASIKVTFPIIPLIGGGLELKVRVRQEGDARVHKVEIEPGWADRIPGVNGFVSDVMDLAIALFATPIDQVDSLFIDSLATYMEYYVRNDHVAIHITR